MKGTQPHSPDQIKNVRNAEIKKVAKDMGVMLPGDGHLVFEFNKNTHVLDIVTPEKTDITWWDAKNNKMKSGRKRQKTKPGCWYFSALNQQNAVKKILKKYPHVEEIKIIID